METVTWVPARMPEPLLQELYWPDAWKVLTICVFLNCTQRKQVEPMIDAFFEKFSSPHMYVEAYEKNRLEIIEMIRPLGFFNRRSERLYKLSIAISNSWNDVRDLPGVGEYAARVYEMLFLGKFGDTPPNDHATADYYWFYKENNSNKKILL